MLTDIAYFQLLSLSSQGYSTLCVEVKSFLLTSHYGGTDRRTTIIESVLSTSRDGPDTPIHAIQYNRPKNSGFMLSNQHCLNLGYLLKPRMSQGQETTHVLYKSQPGSVKTGYLPSLQVWHEREPGFEAISTLAQPLTMFSA